MKRKAKAQDPVAAKLDDLHTTLDRLLILECARTGMSGDEIHSLVGGDNNRIAKITRLVKSRSA